MSTSYQFCRDSDLKNEEIIKKFAARLQCEIADRFDELEAVLTPPIDLHQIRKNFANRIVVDLEGWGPGEEDFCTTSSSKDGITAHFSGVHGIYSLEDAKAYYHHISKNAVCLIRDEYGKVYQWDEFEKLMKSIPLK